MASGTAMSNLIAGLLQPMPYLGGGVVLGWWLQGWRRPRARQARAKPGPGEPWPVPPALLRGWLEALPQGLLVLAPDGSVASLNQRGEQLLRLEQGLAVLGQPLEALEPGEDVSHLVALARDRGRPQRGSWLRPGGTLELRVLPGSGGWVAVLLEGRNPLQSQLERQEAWVSDVAHELRTPLTALMLVGESLADRIEGPGQTLVHRLQRELTRLQELVNDLLVLSRLENTPVAESGRQSTIDPRDVLGSVWASLEPLAAERRVRLKVRPGRDQARWLAVDPARLHQALLNLLDNALRYSPDDGTITVTVEHRDRWCLIGVHDQGPGLSEIDLQRLFQRFYRGDPSRARAPRVGSGLGLAIVQQIALSQGGLVRARNHPEGGAVLELLLQRA